MSRDRSLEEFAGGTAPEDKESSDGRNPDAADGGQSGTGDTPLASTYRWTPSGEPCAVCGERDSARWRDDDELVCADCKEW